jgi:hypothetical protein
MQQCTFLDSYPSKQKDGKKDVNRSFLRNLIYTMEYEVREGGEGMHASMK